MKERDLKKEGIGGKGRGKEECVEVIPACYVGVHYYTGEYTRPTHRKNPRKLSVMMMVVMMVASEVYR